MKVIYPKAPPCLECHKHPVDGYMVKDNIWTRFYDEFSGWVCSRCFQDKLGRPLTKEDLIDCLMSRGFLDGLSKEEISKYASLLNLYSG